jgi:hypothetical protein
LGGFVDRYPSDESLGYCRSSHHGTLKAADEERFVLLATHKILVERGLCLREHTDTGTILIFPTTGASDIPQPDK